MTPEQSDDAFEYIDSSLRQKPLTPEGRDRIRARVRIMGWVSLILGLVVAVSPLVAWGPLAAEAGSPGAGSDGGGFPGWSRVLVLFYAAGFLMIVGLFVVCFGARPGLPRSPDNNDLENENDLDYDSSRVTNGNTGCSGKKRG